VTVLCHRQAGRLRKPVAVARFARHFRDQIFLVQQRPSFTSRFLFYVSSGLQHVKQRLVIVKDRSRELGRIEQVGLATD
jgi:hypothetical protein